MRTTLFTILLLSLLTVAPMLRGADRPNVLLVMTDHLVVELGDSEYVRMVRSDRYKYIVYASSSDAQMLFDLQADPHETKNLAAETAMKPVIEEHRALLTQWIAGPVTSLHFLLMARPAEAATPFVPGEA